MSGMFYETLWCVLRVRTASGAVYSLALYKLGDFMIAYLKGATSAGVAVHTRDTLARVGERLLFVEDPSTWAGRPLRIGGVHTSAITSVEPETDVAVIRDVLMSSFDADPERTVAMLDAVERSEMTYLDDEAWRS
jgi:hypothetical protein